jgi:threonylcarbamoyladenosine tRNA methylthiotransferase MtaB
MPDASIGCDVIVGFPGETDAHFGRTLALLTELPVSYLHVFTYSERPDTAAKALASRSPSLRVSSSERSRRNRVLRLLSERKRRAFYERHLGTERAILWEEAAPGDTVEGFTDNYIRVASNRATPGSLETASLESLDEKGRVRAGDGAFLPLL